MAFAIKKTVAGADVHEICMATDTFVDEEIKKIFNNKKSKHLERGIAFPCCLSINEVAGHYSPLKEESRALADGDVVSIDLGAHMDGFAALAAQTIVIGGAAKGRQADVVLAAHAAFQAVTKMMQPGTKNTDMTAMIERCTKQFDCEPLHGVLSYKNKQHMIDGGDCILNKHIPDQKPKDWELAAGDVICIDIYASTGTGVSRQAQETRCTVHKREIDVQYSLKSKHSRAFLTIVNEKYPTMPFSTAGFEDVTGTKVGVKECVEHEMLEAYPVITEKAGEYVAQFKATVVVQPSSTVIIAGGAAPTDKLDSDKSVTDAELKAAIGKELWKREKKAKAAADEK